MRAARKRARRRVALRVGLLLAAALLTAARCTGPIKGESFIDTGPLPCNTSGHVDWNNPTASTLQVVKVEHLFLVSPGAVANVGGTAVRISDGAILSTTSWDHYEEPTGLSNLISDFSPDYFAIAPGDGIRIAYSCATVSGTVQFEQTLTVWH